MAFFIIREDGVPAGCGGLKFFEGFAEIKRMYVRPGFRREGLGKMMLEQLETYALKQGTILLRLETGIHQPEAMGLYERMGYYEIPPFPPYADSTARLSRFYEKRLV